ncbi:MAG: hypothetical protein HPY83_13675 [Anaerolineae bacterium]|nr:hypothetical protein [Anaerolineae bacterium]
MPGTFVARSGLVLLVVAVAAIAWWCGAAAEDPCESPANLTFNCQFDTFGAAPGGEVPTGWWPFVIAGHPAFDAASDTPKQPALRIWSDGEGFVAGIYQEVSGVELGATYEAFIGWAVFQSEGPEMGRAVGIDPWGGTDPQSPSVVWSPEVWEKKRTNPELRARAVAESDRITVFVRVNNPRTYGADQAFLDAVSLVRDESVPVMEPQATLALAPTATSEPVSPSTQAPEMPPSPSGSPVPSETSPPTTTSTATPEAVVTATQTAGPRRSQTAPSLPPTATPRPSPQVWVLASAAATLPPALYVTPEVEVAAVSGGGGLGLLLAAAGFAGLAAVAASRRSRQR